MPSTINAANKKNLIMTQQSFFPKSLSHWRLFFLIIVPVLIFAILLILVIQQTTQAWDIAVMQAIHTWSNPVLDRLMIIVTDTGGIGRAVPFVFVVAWLLWRGLRLETWTLLGAAAIGQAFTWLFKWLVDRPRPNAFETLRALPTDASFPSGHALGSTIFYGLLGIWLWQNGRRGWAMVFFIWAALVSFSRVYLGVHHPTDVMASASLGIAWLTVVTLFYNDMKRRHNDLSAHHH